MSKNEALIEGMTDTGVRFCAPKPLMDWQPIETAPRDGTHILAVSITGFRTIVFWDEDRWVRQDESLFIPKLWMPLPEPPK